MYNQISKDTIIAGGQAREKARDWGMVRFDFASNLIGWESGTTIFNQSPSEEKRTYATALLNLVCLFRIACGVLKESAS